MGWKDTEIEEDMPAQKASSWKDTEQELDIDKSQSAFKGALQGLTFGASDELLGGIEALGSMAGFRTITPEGEFGWPRWETPEEKQQSFSDVYTSARDTARARQEEAQKVNPKSYLAGEIGGGIVQGLGTAGMLGNADKLSKAKNLWQLGKEGAKIGAVEGGIAGAGYSEADLTKGDVGQFAKDIVKGSAIGAGAGLAAPYAGKAIVKGAQATKKIPGAIMNAPKAIKELPETVYERLKMLKRGAKEGASGEMVFKDSKLEGPERLIKGLKGMVSEAGETKAIGQEFKEAVSKAKGLAIKKLELEAGDNIEVIGNGKKIIDEMTDEEALLYALSEEGSNPVKEWVSTKAAEYPGRLPKEQIQEMWEMSTERITKARDAAGKDWEIAKNFKKPMEDFKEFINDEQNIRFGKLQNIARDMYQPEETMGAIKNLNNTLEDVAKKRTTPQQVKDIILDAKDMILEGQGMEVEGLIPGKLADVDAGEHFNRLQKARMYIDKFRKEFEGKGSTTKEELLAKARNDIDKILKAVPGKDKADKIFSDLEKYEELLFDPITYKRGKIREIDTAKIKNMMKGSDSARRYQEQIEEFKNYLNSNFIKNDPLRLKGLQQVSEIEDVVRMFQDKAKVEAFKYGQGPTSGFGERLQASLPSGEKASTVKDLVMGPSTGRLSFVEKIKSIEKVLNKQNKDFTPSERSGLVRYMMWTRDNPMASDKATQSKLMELFPQLRKKEAIDKFTKQ